ncbi:hypothetical protein ACFWP5_48780 [Streptomyces sp. NPDC058469]|uniref:hypothetical protein n=1 Tax=Streptomyces sp. NPDC058469 TaxID=3346514 RepID=UPI00365A67F2
MRLDFTLVGRDHLSRVLDRAGDASNRLGRRLLTTSINGDAAMRRMTHNTTRYLAGMQRDSEAGGKALEELKKATMLLAPAAIPAAASLLPIAAGAGAVAVASGAMIAAMVPQIAALNTAADAEKKYETAVTQHGAASAQAIEAQTAYQQSVAKMPPATKQAAAALVTLKKDYQGWSDSLAGDTMPVFTKGLALANTLLPKTSGLVKAASTEASRFETIVGGEMASPGLDRLNGKFTSFAQKTLRNVNDEIVHLLRAGQGTNVGGPAREFMDWAKAQGPTVAGVLKSVATALVHLLQAGSDVGVGLLQAVEVVSRLVSAVPPQAIAIFLQLALALKVAKAAALGLAAGRTALAGFATQIVAMQTAAAGAPGRLRGVGAAIGALSRSAKVALVGTGIGLLIIALTQLSSVGKKTPPDVDKLTTSLGHLAQTGKVTGEAARAFGADLGGLADSLRTLSRPSNLDKTQQFLTSLVGMDSTPVAEAKKDLDGVDQALAGLVQGGKADLAKAAFDRVAASMRKQGMSTAELRSHLGDYTSALDDQAFESQLAAQAQGLFGQQAQKTQAALAAQKQSADGLRQSIQALNDVNRSALGGMIGFEGAIDSAAEAAKKNAGALSMSHGQLDLNSQKARDAASALSDLAAKTDEAAGDARENGSSWEQVNAIYTRGRSAIIKNAQAMGLSASQAKQLADQILKIPDRTATVKMNKEDAQRDLTAFNAALKASPGSKSVTLKTLSKSGEQVLESFGLKVKRLPNGSVTVTTKGGALSAITNIGAALRALNGKSARTTVYSDHINTTIYRTKGSLHDVVGATGGLFTGAGFQHRGYADGGLVDGPGSETSDGVYAPWLSKNEFVVNARRTRQYLPLLKALNSGKLSLGSLTGSGGGTAAAGMEAGRGLAAGMTGAAGLVGRAARTMASAVEAGIRDELEIRSPSKRTKALAADVGKGFIVGLTSAQAKIKSTSKDLVKDIKTAFSGKKESGLVAMVDRDTKKLLTAAAKRDKIAATIAAAKTYASDVTKNAREGAGLSNLGLEPEQVSAGSIKAGLAGKLAQVKQFTKYIDILAKKGLNKGLLRQILNMGPDAGYAYASALVGADKGTFKSINSLQSQLDKSTTTLGQVGADRLYDSGKNASKGFLTGLLSQEKDLEKVMEKLAKSMQKSLKKALGIKSPATKMIPHGINTARGVAVGVLAGLPHVDRAMQTMAGRMTGRAAVAGRPAVAAAGAGSMNVQISVTDARDPIATAKEIRRELLELKRVFGMNVELKVG